MERKMVVSWAWGFLLRWLYFMLCFYLPWQVALHDC